MKSELISKVERYYEEKIREFGAEPKGVDWKDEHSQNLRFEQLLKVIDNDKPVTLNDLGCGYGALFLYSTRQASFRVSKYYGYDICSDMLTSARNLIPNERVSFVKSDRIIFDAEYSICSGVFNVKLDTEQAEWEKSVLDILFNMSEKCLRGFAFNCLTSYVDYKMDHLYYGDPLFYFDFCKKNFSRNVALLHDYELYEWTILVRKDLKV